MRDSEKINTDDLIARLSRSKELFKKLESIFKNKKDKESFAKFDDDLSDLQFMSAAEYNQLLKLLKNKKYAYPKASEFFTSAATLITSADKFFKFSITIPSTINPKPGSKPSSHKLPSQWSDRLELIGFAVQSYSAKSKIFSDCYEKLTEIFNEAIDKFSSSTSKLSTILMVEDSHFKNEQDSFHSSLMDLKIDFLHSAHTIPSLDIKILCQQFSNDASALRSTTYKKAFSNWCRTNRPNSELSNFSKLINGDKVTRVALKNSLGSLSKESLSSKIKSISEYFEKISNASFELGLAIHKEDTQFLSVLGKYYAVDINLGTKASFKSSINLVLRKLEHQLNPIISKLNKKNSKGYFKISSAENITGLFQDEYLNTMIELDSRFLGKDKQTFVDALNYAVKTKGLPAPEKATLLSTLDYVVKTKDLATPEKATLVSTLNYLVKTKVPAFEKATLLSTLKYVMKTQALADSEKETSSKKLVSTSALNDVLTILTHILSKIEGKDSESSLPLLFLLLDGAIILNGPDSSVELLHAFNAIKDTGSIQDIFDVLSKNKLMIENKFIIRAIDLFSKSIENKDYSLLPSINHLIKKSHIDYTLTKDEPLEDVKLVVESLKSFFENIEFKNINNFIPSPQEVDGLHSSMKAYKRFVSNTVEKRINTENARLSSNNKKNEPLNAALKSLRDSLNLMIPDKIEKKSLTNFLYKIDIMTVKAKVTKGKKVSTKIDSDNAFKESVKSIVNRVKKTFKDKVSPKLKIDALKEHSGKSLSKGQASAASIFFVILNILTLGIPAAIKKATTGSFLFWSKPKSQREAESIQKTIDKLPDSEPSLKRFIPK